MSSSKKLAKSKEFLQERRALSLSIAMGMTLAVVGISIGIIGGSQIVLFDGFYTFLGIGLTWMAMRVSHLVEEGPTIRYPYGREALVPLIIGIEGVALLATCAYASFNAVLSIIGGGTSAPNGWSFSYAVTALVIPTLIWWRLRRVAQRSELVRAEATQWLAGAALGLAILLAFIAATLMTGTSWALGAKYVDPSLVIGACALFVIAPAAMVRTTFIELIEGVPDPQLQETAQLALDHVAFQFALTDRHMRMTKIGRKFYVEIDFVVDPTWTVAQSDQVRQVLFRMLKSIPHDLWLTLEFTADRALVD
jgi:predicted Co/Zn/Cd cation transporter (cation efflux family)